MPDLTRDDVLSQLNALGLQPVDDEDLDEITHRINAIHEALHALEPEGLDEQEPMTIFDGQEGR
jgi:hypothetical protein